jgi:FkbH-like protein
VDTISFLSNTVTNGFSRHFKKYFEVSHHDLDTIFVVLNTKVDSDYLVILLDHRFFFDTNIADIAYEKAELLKESIKRFRDNNSSKIILSNISSSFINLNSTQNINEYEKLINLNKSIESIANEVADTVILNIFNISMHIGIDNMINSQNMYLFQSPFTKIAIEKISDEIKKSIHLFNVKKAKVVAVDADNTLWGGIIGEDGIDGVNIDQNYPGIIYEQFQKQLLMLKDSGIVLCMVSKNNEKDVLELFDKKSMPIKIDDFIIKKINWTPKSQNIQAIADEMNLGVDSIIFIDDSDFEIGEVKDSLGIDTIQVSKDNIVSNLSLLENNPRVCSIRVTNEDKNKSNMYKAEESRKSLKSGYKDLSEYIKSLDIKIAYNINNISNLQRVTQLINKTNQFNLTTKRYTESEVKEMMQNDLVFDFKVTDKFGDMGVVSVVIVKDNTIDTFLMSCRVLGRDIEKKILHIVQKESKKEELFSSYIKSAKNIQVSEFYDKNSFEVVSKDENSTNYSISSTIPDIEYIEVI